MIELFSGGIVHAAGVETLDMLPCVARLAINCVAVIVGKVADTLDGIRLLVRGLDDWQRIIRRDRRVRIESGLNRSRDLRCDR